MKFHVLISHTFLLACHIFQYLPHEIIKKIGWVVYHPKFVKLRLQIVAIVKVLVGKKEAVQVVENGRNRRFTESVNNMMDDIADDGVGRQVHSLLQITFTYNHKS